MRSFLLGSLVAAYLLTGCASTTVETTGLRLKEPLCQAGQRPITAIVYWGTKWRPDQKEPTLREAAASRGIQDFVGSVSCLSVIAVSRLTSEQSTVPNEELMRLASNLSPKPERVLLIVVRELGPRLVIGIPVVVEGGTEALIDVSVLDATISKPLSVTQTLWRNGGTFVIKGVKTLDKDMTLALKSTLMRDGM